jgi:hypothetical protein
MRSLLLIVLLPILLGASPAGADDWIALWRIDDLFLGMVENGEVYSHDPATGETQLTGTFGAGPWVSFGRHDEQLLALKSNGEVWAMPASTGIPMLCCTLPADREWCALQQHPDIDPSFAISCAGEVWSLYEPVEMLADFGLYAAGRWICIANADDSFFATLESGDTWQGFGESFDPSGTYGPGPWVGFSRTYGIGGNFIALGADGEIWAHGWTGNPSLFLVLPGDRDWCALLTGPVWNTGPGYALTCTGEIWSVASPPAHVGTFVSAVPVERSTWGRIKSACFAKRPSGSPQSQ